MSATLAQTGLRDSLMVDTLRRWSVGANVEWLDREMKPDGGGADSRMEAKTICLFLGYDVQDWLMAYGTFGETEARVKSLGRYDGSEFKFSVGLQASLWKTEVMDPAFMAGVLSVKAIGEVARYSFDAEDSGAQGHWNELSLALPFCYEVYAEREDVIDAIPYSLIVSLGPAVSLVEGSGTTRGVHKDFSGRDPIGFIAGMDVYISHNLSVGCQVEYFDHTTLSASAAYHF